MEADGFPYVMCGFPSPVNGGEWDLEIPPVTSRQADGRGELVGPQDLEELASGRAPAHSWWTGGSSRRNRQTPEMRL